MVAVRFAVATHILVLLTMASRTQRGIRPGHAATSGRLAGIVRTSPVVVRRITGQLARAGLLRVHGGREGTELARPAVVITLDDIWEAVDANTDRPLVPLHSGTPLAGADPVEDPIAPVLQAAFTEAERSFRAALARTRLAALARRVQHAP